MSKAAEAGLVNAEFVLKTRAKELEREIGKAGADKKKATKELLRLMKKGDEEMINGQAELVANLEANINSMSRTKQKLIIFATKVKVTRTKQNVGAGMVAVSRALSKVTNSIELEKVEQIMENLAKQYEDIDILTSVLDNATGQSTAHDVPQEDIDRVKRMVADEAGFELSQELNSAAVDVNAIRTAPIKATPTAEEEATITDRLKALREVV